jgi:hypothetical protein
MARPVGRPIPVPTVWTEQMELLEEIDQQLAAVITELETLRLLREEVRAILVREKRRPPAT